MRRVGLVWLVLLAACAGAHPLHRGDELPRLFDEARGHARYVAAFSPT